MKRVRVAAIAPTRPIYAGSRGSVAAAATLEATRELMKETIEFHIEGMRLHGEIVHEPSSLAGMIEAGSAR